MNYRDFLIEKRFYIDIDSGTSDLPNLKRYGRVSETAWNRLKHLLYQLDQTGSPLTGEKVAQFLLNASNLNYYDKSYPFVDIQVDKAIPGVTEKGEYVSIKTATQADTKAKTSNLRNAVTYVNGFKLHQVVQFATELLPLRLYKNKIFKDRYAKKNYIFNDMMYRFLKELSKVKVKDIADKLKDENLSLNNIKKTLDFIHEHVYKNQVYYILLFDEYLKSLRTEEKGKVVGTKIIDPDNEAKARFFALIIGDLLYPNFKTSTNKDAIVLIFREVIKNVGKKIILKDQYVEEMGNLSIYSRVGSGEDLSYIPEKVADVKTSFCILYFDVQDEEDENHIKLHVQKTRSLNVKELLSRSTEEWEKDSESRGKDKKNYYFKFKQVLKIFEPEKDPDDPNVEFDTHIIIDFSLQDDIKDKTKKLMVSVIDNVKGVGDSKVGEQILKNINRLINFMNSKAPVKKKKNVLNNFKDYLKNPTI